MIAAAQPGSYTQSPLICPCPGVVRKMALFNVGDYVERVGTLVPEYMKSGRVVRVVPHPDLPKGFTEYEIDFKFVVATFYESQLRLAEGKSGPNHSR
jgi:hypothetical protein